MTAISCPFSAIVFDLDGTLIDSAPDIGKAANAVLAERGLDPVEAPLIRRFIGDGGRVLMQHALTYRGVALDDAILDAAFKRFRMHYESAPVGGTRLFPGALEALHRLRAEGAKLAVCTNKYETLTLDILRRLDVLDLFGAVTGGDTFAVRKPDPGHLLGTLARIGAVAADAAMIGDSIHDVGTARGAKVKVVAVEWGYSATPAAQLGADAVIGDYRQLPEVLRRLRTAPGLS